MKFIYSINAEETKVRMEAISENNTQEQAISNFCRGGWVDRFSDRPYRMVEKPNEDLDPISICSSNKNDHYIVIRDTGKITTEVVADKETVIDMAMRILYKNKNVREIIMVKLHSDTSCNINFEPSCYHCGPEEATLWMYSE